MGIHLEVDTLFEKGVVFYGLSDEDMFTTAALWLCNSVTDLEKVNNRITYHIEGGGFSKEEMLVSFLNRILEQIRNYDMIFMDFKTRFFDIRGHGVETYAYGEPFMEKHILREKQVLKVKMTDGNKFRGLVDPCKFSHFPVSAEIQIIYEEQKGQEDGTRSRNDQY